MHYKTLDTPALLINKEIMIDNLKLMQHYADQYNVDLRPHTKTHKMSQLALLQEELGANGITVAKVGEAEIMASKGLKNLLIANEIIGKIKYKRIKKLSESINITFGIDSIAGAQMIETIFDADRPAKVLIEIEVGENRSGIIEEQTFIDLLKYIKRSEKIEFKGIFSHDGHSYQAKDLDDLKQIHHDSQVRTLNFANIAAQHDMPPQTVSIGSTPSLMQGFEILDGITEIRPGTYIFMDVSQANAYGSFEKNAATILATVISKPTDDRVILDVGAKGLTTQSRSTGITATKGLGLIKNHNVYIDDVYDEHAIIYDKNFRNSVKIGDKVEIIPNHICPVVNLHEEAYLIGNNEVLETITVDCRGKLK